MIDSLLFHHLTKVADLCWTSHYQQPFGTLKEKLCIALILQGPNWPLPFQIYIDVSYMQSGIVLGQKEE